MRSDEVQRRLEDIRDNIALARQFIAASSFDGFVADTRTIYAVTRALEIISEASRHLDDETRARHPEIDWIAIRDAGNVYRHGYELVTEKRLWETVTHHLPALEQAILAELNR